MDKNVYASQVFSLSTTPVSNVAKTLSMMKPNKSANVFKDSSVNKIIVNLVMEVVKLVMDQQEMIV